MIKLDLKNALNEKEILKYQDKVKQINEVIEKKTGLGNDFLGWVNYAEIIDKTELERIVKCSEYVRNNFDILVVCGIGGSYLGARAAIEALNGLYSKDKLEIVYLGNTFSPNYTAQVIDYLKDKKFAINVISKSGTTTETSIAFRLLKDLLEKQVGKEKARRAIFATTDKKSGALRNLANIEGYETFVLPDDVGGRYSIFTPVGLFPLACAGRDIKMFLSGANEGKLRYSNPTLKENACYMYACARDYMLVHERKSVELFVQYEPHLTQISEWLKQLFAESEGKDKKGLLPDSVSFSTDLHSLGQFIQDGTPLLFETILRIKKSSIDIKIPHDKDDLDGLNYLENKELSYVNEKAFLGTLKAHHDDGGVPCIIIEVDELNENSLGELLYFFMRACAMSAYLLNVNPFNQPGVEIYKKNMFHLLGKKGY
ncbi:MAG: glucose-6-phosphate isomerase [Erysipelotrichaceae bacterium]|nr:glucose-6-phosphate isomerase [Erysipelotrichaceae bacterium]